MFKQIVTDLIGQHLNRYIEDFDSNSIHFTGFPSSNLRLNHLRIKPDALSALQLPVVLKHGYVGSLHIVIPGRGCDRGNHLTAPEFAGPTSLVRRPRFTRVSHEAQ